MYLYLKLSWIRYVSIVQGWDLIVVDFFVRITCSLPIWPF